MISFTAIDTQLGDQKEDRHVHGYEKAVEYLEQRGIPPELMVALGIRVCFANELLEQVLKKKCYDDRLAVIFPHYAPDGLLYEWWSARLVPLTERVRDRRGKMFCPPHEAPVAYLPWTLDWKQIKSGDKVYIHESAIKAANCARLDRWAIGLNGVRGWSAMKYNRPLIEGLKDIPWKTMELKPVIVFDSNTLDNPDVQDARVRLAAKLKEITGRDCWTLNLPIHAGAHQGFDDFCVREGDTAALAFLEGELEQVDIGEYDQLRMELNARCAVVRNISRVVEIETGVQMNKHAFCEMNYADMTIEKDDGGRTNFPKLWLADPRRTIVDRMEYAPGEPKLTKEFLNLWNGMGVEPAQGDVKLWLDVLERGIPDMALRKWVTQWFAYPLQNLGAKLTTFIHMFSTPGTGKNALLLPFMRIYGANAMVVPKERLLADFNKLYAARQFVNFDELHGGNDSSAIVVSNKIKVLTTGEKITVNGKGEQEYEIVNHVNLVTTSNYSDSVRLDDNDRRACVIQFGTKETVIKDRQYWTDYWNWGKSEEGAAALYSFMLSVDMEGFDPSGWAPETPWKAIVTDATRGPMEKWVQDLWEDPSLVLPPLLLGAMVLSNDQLGIAYMPEESHKVTPGLKNALAQRMQDAGFEKRQVKIDGVPKRLWIVADRKGSWSNDRIREEYTKGAARTKGKF